MGKYNGMKIYTCLVEWAGPGELEKTFLFRLKAFENARRNAEETFKGIKGIPQIFVKESNEGEG